MSSRVTGGKRYSDAPDINERKKFYTAAMNEPQNRQLYEMMVRQLYHDGYVDVAENLSQSAHIAVSDVHKNGNRLQQLVSDGLLTNVLRARELKEYALRHRVEYFLEANALYVPLPSLRPGRMKMEQRFETSYLGGAIRATAISMHGDLIACGGDKAVGARIFSRSAFEGEMLIATASGITEGSTAVITASNISEARSFSDHSQTVETVAFHPREPWLLSGGREGHLCLLNFSSPQQTMLLKHEDTFPVRAACFHPSGSHILFATDHAAPRLIGVAMGDINTPVNNPHNAALASVAFSPDGALFSTASFDGSIGVFDSSSSKSVLHRPKAHSNVPVTSCVFSRSSFTLLTAGMDSVARVWDVRYFKDEVACFGTPAKTDHGYRIQAKFNSAESHIFIQNSNLEKLYLFDIYSGSEVNTIASPDAPIRSFSPASYDGAIATGGEDGRLKMWSPTTIDFAN
eukprot:Tbor_TRINITY_DN4289_c0_g1::TRINITY_DN4289_c0_g1_i1::g.24055::m.24055/K14406/CSTF1; cleavage stimulation factor subunit 1